MKQKPHLKKNNPFVPRRYTTILDFPGNFLSNSIYV